MRLIIGLACRFSRYQYITECRIPFSDTWHNNCQSGKAKAETSFNLLLK